MDIEQAPIGVYGSSGFGLSGAGGSAILIAPGYVSWAGGRNNATVKLWYLNGWPHAGLTEDTTGATTIQVDDVTGFSGASAFIYDGAATEQVSVVSVTADQSVTVPGGTVQPTGPGTLTLAAACQAHTAGVVVSALPMDIPWAACLLATAQVLQSGASAVTIQNLPGSIQNNGSAVTELRDVAHKLLTPYRRVI